VGADSGPLLDDGQTGTNPLRSAYGALPGAMPGVVPLRGKSQDPPARTLCTIYGAGILKLLIAHWLWLSITVQNYACNLFTINNIQSEVKPI
jgi:hypothetical protein